MAMSACHHPSSISSHPNLTLKSTIDDIKMAGSYDIEDPPSIQDLINRHYRGQPSSIAICSTTQGITYRDLGQHTATVSQYLKDNGIQHGGRVGVCLEKSPFAVIAIMGILRAGAAYVPIDPSYSSTQIDDIVKKAQLGFVITEDALVGRVFSKYRDIQVLTPYRYRDIQTPIFWGDEIEPDMTAPVCATFTPGSDSGHVYEHGNVLSNILNIINSFELSKKTRFLQYAPYVSDASLIEIFAPLVAGGCLCIASENERLHSLDSVMDSLFVTHANLPSDAAGQITPDKLPSLNNLYISGQSPSVWSSRSNDTPEMPGLEFGKRLAVL